jgi:hypothetical protein
MQNAEGRMQKEERLDAASTFCILQSAFCIPSYPYMTIVIRAS